MSRAKRTLNTARTLAFSGFSAGAAWILAAAIMGGGLVFNGAAMLAAMLLSGAAVGYALAMSQERADVRRELRELRALDGVNGASVCMFGASDWSGSSTGREQCVVHGGYRDLPIGLCTEAIRRASADR